MKTSKAGIDLIARFEGCHKKVGNMYVPYRCPAGLWTVGFGTLIGNGKTLPKEWDRAFTLAECKEMLAQELRSKERGVTKLISYPLKQCEFDALVSFAYNLGLGCLQRSQIRQKINRGDFIGASRSLLKYNKAKDPKTGVYKELRGLTRRRQAEADLLMLGRN